MLGWGIFGYIFGRNSAMTDAEKQERHDKRAAVRERRKAVPWFNADLWPIYTVLGIVALVVLFSR